MKRHLQYSANIPLIIFGLTMCIASIAQAENFERVPRHVIALYDSSHEQDVRRISAHVLAELPLNYLGLNVQYWDLRQGWPDAAHIRASRGVLAWIETWRLDQPSEFFSWASSVVDAGKRVVLIGSPWEVRDHQGKPAELAIIDGFMRRLGVGVKSPVHDVTYRTSVVMQNRSMMGFERAIGPPFPPYGDYEPIREPVTSHLVLSPGGHKPRSSHVVITGPGGGFVERGYAVHQVIGSPVRLWLLNPFKFFATALGVADEPRPDPTTLAGRRVFFAQVGSSGADLRSDVFGYRRAHVSAAQVVLDKVVRNYSQLPLSVSVAAPNLTSTEVGTFAIRQDQWLINAISGMGNVVLTGDLVNRTESIPTLALMSGINIDPGLDKLITHHEANPDQRVAAWNLQQAWLPTGYQHPVGLAPLVVSLSPNYLTMRFSYTELTPFTMPANGAANMVYGGIAVTNPQQFLTELSALDRSEQPRRVRPYGLYFELGSGRDEGHLHRVRNALDQANKESLIPITVPDYAALVQGFTRCEITRSGLNRWRVQSCAPLATVRFDQASGLSVDFDKSTGVIGQRHMHGSLYVALDNALEDALIVLRPQTHSGNESIASGPFLIDSRWQISHVKVTGKDVEFRAQGFGSGQMQWRFPQAGSVSVNVRVGEQLEWAERMETDQEGLLQLTIPVNGMAGVLVSLEWEGRIKQKAEGTVL